MAQLPELRTQADAVKAMQFSPAEVAASANTDPVADAARHQANIVELRKEIARNSDPEILKILREEYNRLQGPTADSGDLMDFKVYGKTGATPTEPAAIKGPLMDFKVYGKTPAQAPAEATPAEANAGPNAAFGTNEAGAATGIQPNRLQPIAPGREEQGVGPTEKRLGFELGGAATGAAIGGAALNLPGAVLGAGIGGIAGSIAAEFSDPTQNPIKEALITGATSAGAQTFGSGSMAGFRYMLGKPSANGKHLLDIMEARGLVPPAGTVLEGSLAKNMQAIGSSDAFFGAKVQQAVKDAGNVVTDDLRNYISGYQRFYVGAKEGFKIWDSSAKQLLGPEADIVALDRGVIDKLKVAQRTWDSVGAAVDFPLRQMLDDLAAAEARVGGSKFPAFRVNLEQAEAVRQLLHQQANALAGTGRTETGQAVGKDVAQAVRKAAYKVGDDIEFALDLAVKDGRIPMQARAILTESREMWKQWKVGEALQNELTDTLKLSERTGAPITSEAVYGALGRIEAESKRLHKPILTSGETARLESIGKALQATEASQHSTQFTMAVRAGQLFALSGGAGTMMGAVPMALIPAALGFVVRNPEASALLIRGLRLPAGSAAGVRAANQLATILAKEGFLAPVERKAQSADQPASGQP